MTGPAFVLKSYQFRKEREARWLELEELVEGVEARGLGVLSGDQIYRLASLYRGAASSLSVARAISLDKNALDYLEGLVGRAYVCVYGSNLRAGHSVADFFARRFPRAVRAEGRRAVTALALLCLGTLIGLSLVLHDPERFHVFVPRAMAQGRAPEASRESMRESLYSRQDAVSHLNLFAAFLFSNNAKIGLMCFVLGFAAGAPVVLLLVYNGATLGAMAAAFHLHGLSLEFWAWILPHGVTELLAVGLCGAAGLALGSALLFPGRHSRLTELARSGPRAASIAVGAVALFFLAAVIEGFFRQLVHDVAVRWLLALASLAWWGAYFGLAGRGRAASRVAA